MTHPTVLNKKKNKIVITQKRMTMKTESKMLSTDVY